MGSDTVFVARHSFQGPVHNVFDDGKNVFVKAGRYVYQWDEGKWRKLSFESDRYFVFYDSGFFAVEYMLDERSFDPRPMKHLIPQANLLTPTKVQKGKKLFVAVGGSLFEYRLDNNFVRRYPDHSIRHVYKSAGLDVISTYQGIYVDMGKGPIKARGAKYSNGKFWPTPQGQFLLNDEVLLFLPPDSFRQINPEIPANLGKTRKGVFYRDSMVIQMTTSICYFDTSTGFRPLHKGYDYTDIEVLGDKLLFVTSTGELISYNKGTVIVENKVHSPVRDLYIGNAGIFLCSDKGVYFLKSPSDRPELFAALPKAASMVEDNGLNAWISTDFGLYVVPKGSKKILPFLENIEFNRGALEFTKDTIFAGSVQGLYAIDYYYADKTFLPEAIHRLDDIQAKLRRQYMIFGGVSLLAGILLYLVIRRTRKKKLIPLPEQPERKSYLSLEKIKDDIIANNLQSVDSLASFYQTNPVQLNRLFKNFDTTPGRYLKKVKLDLAREMLEQGSSIADIVHKTGYSAHFIKSELKAN